MKFNCILLLAGLTMWSCQTTSPSQQQTLNNSAPYAQYRSLAEALSIHPGLQVTGAQGMEKVIIRQSSQGFNEPLYVINKQPVGNDYMRANQLLNMAQVQSIKVLKRTADTLIYGAMASNGVISIKTNTF